MERTTVGCPVDGIDDGVGPLGILGQEIFAQATSAESVAEDAGNGVGDGDAVVVDGGEDTRNGVGLSVAVSDGSEECAGLPVAPAVFLCWEGKFVERGVRVLMSFYM